MVRNGRIEPIRGAKVRLFIETAIAYALQKCPKGKKSLIFKFF